MSPRPAPHSPHGNQTQGQLQGQLQGQAQGQAQYSAQAVDTSVWNTAVNENANGNDNCNVNGNLNFNANVNEVETYVTTTVDVNLSLDESMLGDTTTTYNTWNDDDIIDIEQIQGITSAVVMPDAVNQATYNGNNFNLDQVSNITDNDTLNNPSVSFDGSGVDGCGRCCADPDAAGDFSMTATSSGGSAISNLAGGITGDDGTFSGIGAARADSVLTQEAFTQNISMGANIQFNSVDLQVVGGDISDAL